MGARAAAEIKTAASWLRRMLRAPPFGCAMGCALGRRPLKSRPWFARELGRQAAENNMAIPPLHHPHRQHQHHRQNMTIIINRPIVVAIVIVAVLRSASSPSLPSAAVDPPQPETGGGSGVERGGSGVERGGSTPRGGGSWAPGCLDSFPWAGFSSRVVS